MPTLRGNSGNAFLARLLPHPSMALWPGIKQITKFDKSESLNLNLKNFIEPYMIQHKAELDPDNIRDFMDLFLLEIKNTKVFCFLDFVFN
jgi:hypothetical protein